MISMHLGISGEHGIDPTEKRLCASMKQQTLYFVTAFLDKQFFFSYPSPEKKRDLPKEDKQLMQKAV
jgi:hypothetical protein